MGRPRFHPVRNTLAAIVIVAAGAMLLTTTGRVAAAEPWQTSWGDYDNHNQWHDANWWLDNQHNWVTVHHPEWTENYASTHGQIGDSDRLHVRHYGDGSLDRQSSGLSTNVPASGSPLDPNAPASAFAGTPTPMEDTIITTEVKAAFADGKDIESDNIQVSTMAGVVTLQGLVETSDMSARVESIARDTTGVLGVTNHLRMHPLALQD
jgi:hypothetical protein